MKIFTIVSPSHDVLLDGWDKTLRHESKAKAFAWRIPIESDGDYRNEQWNQILTMHEFIAGQAIYNNIPEQQNIIGITGVDVRFVAPFVDDVLQLMEGKDVLMQDEDGTRTYLNPDVMFLRCTTKLLKAWIDYLQLLPFWNGHMNTQNRMMRYAFYDLVVDFLPIRYAATLNGGENDPDMRLFHGNNTHAPNCVQKKIDMLKKYERSE